MALGLGAMGLSPAAFWALTPREFNAALRWRLPSLADAPSRHELATLMARFPDQ
jgi:uncharacterized phage protein (TIGR02216 family)